MEYPTTFTEARKLLNENPQWFDPDTQFVELENGAALTRTSRKPTEIVLRTDPNGLPLIVFHRGRLDVYNTDKHYMLNFGLMIDLIIHPHGCLAQEDGIYDMMTGRTQRWNSKGVVMIEDRQVIWDRDVGEWVRVDFPQDVL